MAYWVSGSSAPFDDTLKVTTTIGLNTATTGGIDTRPIDGFRQGVELNTVEKFFVSTQPKLWGGSIKFDGRVSHLNETHTYGQAVSFADFFGKSQFDDRLRKFDPSLYIRLGGSYPFPLLFNDGPQQQEENTVEPLTIPYKKSSPESIGYIVRSIHGALEDGQDNSYSGTVLLSQFIEFGPPIATKQFLDQGEQRLGDTFAGSIIVPGYMSTAQQKAKPFVDQEVEYLLTDITV